MFNRYQNFQTRQISSHHNLTNLVDKYAQSEFLRPIPSHQYDVFEKINSFVKEKDRPIILDSGCGTGLSTKILAEQFPLHTVIGIDKSAARLSRAAESRRENLLLVRGDLIDLWRLFARERFNIERHYLLFPNPWPKIGHLKRRFYAHPIFKVMISLAPYFELRTNWEIYAQECTTALSALGHNPKCALKTDREFMTLFEKKYVNANCPIYVVTNIVHKIS